MRIRSLTPLLALVAVSLADPSASGSLDPPGLLPLISRADAFVSTGQFQDAARTYSEAIDQAPHDYLLYYKRATVYFSLNRHPSALEDFEKVLSLTSNNFPKAFLMKAKIYAREGEWGEAKEMVKRYTKQHGQTDQGATDVMFAVSEGEVAAKKAEKAYQAGLWTACMEDASAAIATASHSVSLRQLRADCAMAAGEIDQAVGDQIRLTHITAPSTSTLLRIARTSYFLLPPSAQAASTLKQCLHFDPDSKPCASLHRQLKKFDKAFDKLSTLLSSEPIDWSGVIKLVYGSSLSASPDSAGMGTGLLSQYDAALEEAAPELDLPAALQPLVKHSPRRADLLRALCRAYVGTDQPRKAERWCDALLSMPGNEEDVDALVGRGEAARLREDWEESVRAFEKAWDASGRSRQDVGQKLQKAQRLLKQSRQKDYYKVLGVARDADPKTIKKAYRKAAMTAHPDKGGSEAKMAAVNEAYEVLSDPELRARFDNGDDPNDPQGGGGGHGHPVFFQGGGFQQFFQGGGGGRSGGNFHFKFGH